MVILENPLIQGDFTRSNPALSFIHSVPRNKDVTARVPAATRNYEDAEKLAGARALTT